MATFPTNDRELTRDVHRRVGGRKAAWGLPWSFLLLFVAFLAVEWFYSPVEIALGNFMVWSRGVRPEAGRGWELNREGAEAQRTLGRLAETTRLRQTAGATLNNWGQVPAMLDSFQVFSISPERFMDLYSQLPPALQSLIVDPVDLLRVRTGGKWQRVFFAREQDHDYVYLVDPGNVVLHQALLDQRFFKRYDAFVHPLAASLNDLKEYTAVVPADTFFQMLAPTGPVELSGIDVRWISSLEGRLTRVGISSEASDGLWDLGFEVVRDGRMYVHRYWISEKLGEELQTQFQLYRARLPQEDAAPREEDSPEGAAL